MGGWVGRGRGKRPDPHPLACDHRHLLATQEEEEECLVVVGGCVCLLSGKTQTHIHLINVLLRGPGRQKSKETGFFPHACMHPTQHTHTNPPKPYTQSTPLD